MKDSLYNYRFILLALLNSSLLMTLGSAAWNYQFTTAILMLVAGLHFLSTRLWWTALLALLPFLILYIPQFPRLTNHGNLLTLIGIFIVIHILFKAIRPQSKSLLQLNLPLLFRLTLISVYFMAGFHKLNTGFFELNGSCSSSVNHTLNHFIFGNDFEPSILQIRISQWGTIILEMLIPFGLLHYRTRKITAWILVLFHFYLSLCNFSNFSGLAGLLIAGSVIDNKSITDWKTILKAVRVYLLFTIIACLVAYSFSRFQIVESLYIRFYNGLFFNIGWLIFFYIVLSKISFNKEKSTVSKWYFIPLLFFISWGGQAYLGLSTAGNLTMFSNLITEKSRSNHLLINTNYTKIWNFEEDYVTIVELPSHLKWQNSIDLIGYDLPLIEFKKQAQNWVNQDTEKITCILLYKGELIKINDLKESEFSKAKWWYHYIYFRKIPKKGVNECLW